MSLAGIIIISKGGEAMIDKLDPQVQIRIIDLAREWMLQLKPVFPKSRSLEIAISTRIDTFAKLHRALVNIVTSESVTSE